MAVTPKTENGWGSVLNGGITGGAGGIEIEFTDFVEMWIWMRNNRTTPAKITYTGNDFSREGFDYIFPNATFSNSARFEIDGLANKTIRASQGQIINWCEIRFRNSNNCIWENWHHKDSSKDLIAIINDSTNIWIRHCTLNHNVFNQIDSPTEKSIDIGWGSDYIAVTDCIIMNNDKTFLISFSNDEPNDVGKMKVTIRRTKFLNCIQRKPRGRYGRIGIEYCVLDDRDLTVSSKSIGVGKLTRFFTYRNTFRGGGTVLFEDRLSIDNFPIEDAGALKSVENVITGSYSSGMNEIRPELVTWDPRTEPNYTLEDWTVEEASAWVDQWAGATMHLMGDAPDPEPPYVLTVSSTTGGTVNTSGGTFAAGTVINLVATPSSGFLFTRYRNLDNDQTLSTNAIYSFEMPENDLNIRAVFTAESTTPPSGNKKFPAKKKR